MIFNRIFKDKTSGHFFKLKEGRVRLYIKEEFFTMRLVRNWNKLPREAVDVSCQELLKIRLDETGQPALVKGIPAHGWD